MRIREHISHKLDAKGNSVFISNYKDLFSNLRYSTIHVRPKGKEVQQFIGQLFHDNNNLYCAVDYDGDREEYLLPLGVALFIGADAIHFLADKDVLCVSVSEIISEPTSNIIDASFVKRYSREQLIRKSLFLL